MTILSKLTFVFGLVAMPALASAQTAAKPDKPDDADRVAMREQRAEARFAKLDADHDGVLSKQEFLAGAKMHQGRHGKWKHGKHQARRGNQRDRKAQAPKP